MQKKIAVAKFALAHPNEREEISDPLQKTVCMELQEYCNNTTDSILKKLRPKVLPAFSIKVIISS